MAASLETLSSVLQTLIKPNSTPEKWLTDRYTSLNPSWYEWFLEQNTKTLNSRTAQGFRAWSEYLSQVKPWGAFRCMECN